MMRETEIVRNSLLYSVKLMIAFVFKFGHFALNEEEKISEKNSNKWFTTDIWCWTHASSSIC